jgi:DNA-binding GntR family transcriptional regulator
MVLYTGEYDASTGVCDALLDRIERVTMGRKKISSNRSSDSSPGPQRAYLHIQRKISEGHLRAGEAISEVSLAKELGISRTPVREALGQLAAEGILERSPNRKAVVVELKRQDIVELYELREALEVYAVGKAARQPARPSDVDRLQGLLDATEGLKKELGRSGNAVLDHEQMQRFVAYDLGFHTLLIRTAANTRISKLVNETRLLIRIFAMRRQGHSGPMLEQINRQHRDVLRAVVNREPELVMRLISEHIQNSLRERLEDYDRWEFEASLRQNVPFFFDTPGSQE